MDKDSTATAELSHLTSVFVKSSVRSADLSRGRKSFASPTASDALLRSAGVVSQTPLANSTGIVAADGGCCTCKNKRDTFDKLNFHYLYFKSIKKFSDVCFWV